MKDESRANPAPEVATDDHTVNPNSMSDLFGILGYQPGERLSINWQERPGGRFRSQLVAVADAPAELAKLPDRACKWFGVNPTSASSGRGTAPDVTRLAALYAELDDKNTTPEQMKAILADLIRLFGEPTVVVHSGHGVHLYWPISDGHITDEFTTDDASRILAQFGEVVTAIAVMHGAGKPDGVSELARVLRIPGTTNWKNTDQPVPVTMNTTVALLPPLTVSVARGLLDKAAEKFPPPAPPPRSSSTWTAPPPDDADHPYVKAALDRELSKLASCPPSGGEHGSRQKQLLRSAGDLARWGCVDRAWLRGALESACDANGYAHDADQTVDDTIDRAFAWADKQEPRTIPERPDNTTYTPHRADDHGVDEHAEPTDDSDPRPQYTDFAALLAGGLPEPPRPTILHRTDGVAIIYAAKRNEVYGDPEAGKTMLAMTAAAEHLAAGVKNLPPDRDGGAVLFLDLDNNGPTETAERLRMLGAPLDAITDPDRFRHCQPDDAAEVLAVVADCAGWATLVVIDCVGELMPMFAGNSDKADDYTNVMRRVAAPLESGGAAVVLLDHPAKGTESRQYGAGGTMAKRRAVSGVSIEVRCRQPFRPGHGGTAEIWVNKDRPGGLRQHCPTGEGRRQYAGTFTLDPPDTDTGRAAWRVSTDRTEPAAAIDPVVERHYDAAAELGPAAATVAAIAAAANGLPPGTPPTESQKKAVRRAMEALVRSGRAELVAGASPQRWDVTQ